MEKNYSKIVLVLLKLAFILALLIYSHNAVQSQPQNTNTNSDLNSIQSILKGWETYYNVNYFSQGFDPEEIEESGYGKFLNAKWFYEMNKDFTGNLADNKWDQFMANRIASLDNSTLSPAADWINLGPNSIDSMGGRMNCITIDPFDNQVLWAGSATGGIWRSTDGGNTWESASGELPSNVISDIQINPSNRDIMLAGTGNDRFVSIGLGPGVGLLKSTDRGLTWNPTGFSYNISQMISVSKIVWHPSGNDTVYMAASNGVWRSSNAGDNWSLILPGRSSSLVINKQSPNILYTVIRSNGVYRSTNGGDNWTLLNNGVATGGLVDLSTLAICDSQPNVLYVTMANASSFGLLGFYRTTDGGNLWSKINNAPNVPCQPNAPAQCQGWYVNTCGVSPVDPDLVFLGGVQFWRSSNGGANWTWHDFFANGSLVSNQGEVYADDWGLTFDPVDPDIIYLVNDGGVQKTTNGGTWWEKKNNGLVTAQIYRIASSPSDTTFMIGGFQDHGLQYFDNSNGNLFWRRWSASDGTNVIVHPTNNNIIYGDVIIASHYKSTTGGVGWAQNTHAINNGITEEGVYFEPLKMSPADPNVLFTTSAAKIYKTTNGGALWLPKANIPLVYTMTFDKNPDIIYGHRYNNSNWAIIKSTDGGTTWDSVTNSSIPSWRVVDLESDPITSGVVYAVRNSAFANQDHIKMSTDFGENWTDITGDLPDIPVNAIAVSPYTSGHLYIATDFGVYASTNNGINWFEFNDGLPIIKIYDIHYHPLDGSVRIATIGRGVWKSKAIDGSVSVQNQTEIAKTFELYQNYPNPFNGGTVIKYNLQKTGNVKLIIYNSAGQTVARLFDGRQEPGSYSINWDAKNSLGMDLASGVYFLKIIAGGFSKSIKLTYIK